MNEFRTCAELDEVIEELALGTMSGPQRAQAIAHLDSCPRCRDLVDGLTTAADSVLLLAPEEPPPLGFEARVAATTGPAAPTEHRPAHPRWRRLAMAGGVAAALFLGVLAGHLFTSTGGSGGVRVALAGADGGRATCRAVVIPGHPAHLVVTIDAPGE
ncbi:MAG TPA: zf-HC2 domain-containing protein, partial [Acidimicrobiales bacterium]